MGGGDLNMKKHFHPLTMENLERVWKAEEKKRKESERCMQLQQELAEERQREELQRQAVESGLKKKKNDRLDWMYSGQQVNTDEYLLGKKIDKNIEIMKEDDNEPLSSGNILKKPVLMTKASDILAKVKEDPLFLIKKKEDENRRELVQNPLKMKKLKALLEVTDHSKKKKRKKEKKKKRDHSPETERYKHSYSRHDDSKDFSARKRDSEGRRISDNRDYRSSHLNNRVERHNHDGRRRHYSNHHNKQARRNSESSDDEAEMEAKRQSMMDNAKWRKDQRINNMQKHNRETKREEEGVRNALAKTNMREEKARFIQKMQVESYSSDATQSVEDRIRRNIHSKQRTNAALEKKFTAR